MKYQSVTLFFAAFALWSAKTTAQKAPQLGKAPIDKVIAAMIPEEKAHLLLGTEMLGATIDGKPRMHAPGAAGATYGILRLGIPALLLADGPAGIRIEPHREGDTKTYYATAFPVGTSLASTWNTTLIERVGNAIGQEVKDYGVDVLLAPALNIQRNPLCGRNFEYYSEDPVVAGEIAAAYVNGVQANGVGTSVKHFAANNQETNRLSINEHITERAMREIYLKGFQIVIKKSSPWTVMSSYNKINGQYTSEREDLLTHILRKEWGFKGFVMSDWFGGYTDFASTGSASSNVTAQMVAGNDVLMPGTIFQYDALVAAIKSGTLSKDVVDRNIKSILEIALKSPAFKKMKYSNTPDLKGHAQIAREAAAEGMVLLKNEGNVLPYNASTGAVALFGITSYNFIAGGTGSGDVNEAYTISLMDGLNTAGYKVDEKLKALYVPFVAEEYKKENERRANSGGILATPKKMPELLLDSQAIAQAAKQNAVAVITIGRNSGENGDRQITADFYIAQDEIRLIENVSKSFHAEGKKVIVILNIGGVVETFSWKDKVDAILLAWQPGQEGGNAVADVVSGKVVPSGKLTMTFPVDFNNNPSSANWLGTPLNDPKDVVYEEGIYVGYRYFNTFNIKPSFEFGYGKSYTDFTYTDVKLSSAVFEDKITVTLTVTNTGKSAGKEAVQLYVSAPGVTVDKPESELKAFAKTKLLQPGASEVVTLQLTATELASFEDTKSAWVAEAGTYEVKIGASCRDIKLKASFVLKEEKVVEKVHNAFTTDVEVNEVKSK
ncbi:MAG: glycoside hydrolase family 3 N-terminal domain-containing protein [Bacteroidota bacterium]